MIPSLYLFPKKVGEEQLQISYLCFIYSSDKRDPRNAAPLNYLGLLEVRIRAVKQNNVSVCCHHNSVNSTGQEP